MQKSEVICDRCHVEITDWDLKQSSAKIHLWGIGAHRSTNPQRIDLCEKCYDKFILFMGNAEGGADHEKREED